MLAAPTVDVGVPHGQSSGTGLSLLDQGLPGTVFSSQKCPETAHPSRPGEKRVRGSCSGGGVAWLRLWADIRSHLRPSIFPFLCENGNNDVGCGWKGL